MKLWELSNNTEVYNKAEIDDIAANATWWWIVVKTYEQWEDDNPILDAWVLAFDSTNKRFAVWDWETHILDLFWIQKVKEPSNLPASWNWFFQDTRDDIDEDNYTLPDWANDNPTVVYNAIHTDFSKLYYKDDDQSVPIAWSNIKASSIETINSALFNKSDLNEMIWNEVGVSSTETTNSALFSKSDLDNMQDQVGASSVETTEDSLTYK